MFPLHHHVFITAPNCCIHNLIIAHDDVNSFAAACCRYKWRGYPLEMQRRCRRKNVCATLMCTPLTKSCSRRPAWRRRQASQKSVSAKPPFGSESACLFAANLCACCRLTEGPMRFIRASRRN